MNLLTPCFTRPLRLSCLLPLVLALTLSTACTAQTGQASPAASSPSKPAQPAVAPCDPTGENPYKPCPRKIPSPAELAASAQEAAATLPKRLEQLKARTFKDLKFVEGGTFTMGDFGPLVGDKLPLTTEKNDDFLREITLDSYSLGAYKVTYGDYDVYSDSVNKKRIAQYPDDQSYRNIPGYPAGVDWFEAQAYCQWLGKQVGAPMDLPTEAQWEYAARNRGKFGFFATDNGEINDGRNVATFKQWQEFGNAHKWASHLPVGRFPATPLGLYDLVGNGREWMQDWYAANYGGKKAEKNPLGPGKGREKVTRGEGGVGGDSLVHNGLVVLRGQETPTPTKSEVARKRPEYTNPNQLYTLRCAAQTPQPLKP